MSWSIFPSATPTIPPIDFRVNMPSNHQVKIMKLSDSCYDALNFFGEGAFGKVVKATESDQVIVKTFVRNKVDYWAKKSTEHIPTGIHLIMNLHHLNIVPLLSAFRLENNLQIVMSRTKGKEVCHNLQKQRNTPIRLIGREMAKSTLIISWLRHFPPKL